MLLWLLFSCILSIIPFYDSIFRRVLGDENSKVYLLRPLCPCGDSSVEWGRDLDERYRICNVPKRRRLSNPTDVPVAVTEMAASDEGDEGDTDEEGNGKGRWKGKWESAAHGTAAPASASTSCPSGTSTPAAGASVPGPSAASTDGTKRPMIFSEPGPSRASMDDHKPLMLLPDNGLMMPGDTVMSMDLSPAVSINSDEIGMFNADDVSDIIDRLQRSPALLEAVKRKSP